MLQQLIAIGLVVCVLISNVNMLAHLSPLILNVNIFILNVSPMVKDALKNQHHANHTSDSLIHVHCIRVLMVQYNVLTI